MNITPEQIDEFLKLNPDFFQNHVELLADIKVPHPHSGQTISLGERQVLLLREKAGNLEAKLREFIQFAEENDSIGDKLHKLSLGLMRARSLEAALQSLYLSLSDSFAVPHATVRIWTEEEGLDIPEFTRVSPDIRVLAAGLSQPQCGPDAPDEVRAWFGESGAHLRSFAITPLNDGRAEGVLVLASEDPKRFFPEMGTLYLSWLGQLTGAGISRFV
ncbi:MAG: DUF484 family protein [Betaproteobacteria bacterium]|nr:DUF484 family protein [Betaproteobacteria bacterium]